MADRRSESERALNEGTRGGILNFDSTEAVPEALGGNSSGLRAQASATGRSVPGTSADTTGGPGLIGKMLGKPGTGPSSATTSAGDALNRDTHQGQPLIPESNLPRDHHGGMNPLKAFTSQGAVGKQFNPEGPIGSIPQAVGGPFDKEGMIGKQFTSDGVIGGTVDKILGEKNPEDPLGRRA